jgi:hypothetical protein
VNASRNTDSNQHSPSANNALEGNGGRDHRSSQSATIYPVSIRNLDSFSLNSSPRIFYSNRSQNSGLSSLIPSPPDAAPGDFEERNRHISINGTEGVNGQETRSAVGRLFRVSGPARQLSVNDTHSGPLASLGSVLPWLLGTRPATLVSFLPISRDSRDVRQPANGTAEQEGEARVSQGGLSDDPRLRRRSVPVPQ